MENDRIDLPGAPEIPGLVFRRFRAPGDFQAMADITRASAVVDGTERADTAEELATVYAHLTNCDVATDFIAAEIQAPDNPPPQVVGYARATWREAAPGSRRYLFFGRVTPAWRRKGIGGALLSWIETRLRQIAASHPPEIEKSFLCYVDQGELGLRQMLEKAGYRPVRYYFEMVRPDLENIPDFPLPEGLEVRPARPEHYRAIWEADVETQQDDWSFSAPSEADYQGWLADQTVFQPGLWQVAWDVAGNEIAGQVLAYIDHKQNQLYRRQRGYTEYIGVRRPWRRRGLARALIVRSLRLQKAAGMTESALLVDSENPSGANRVYEDCGFRVMKTMRAYSKPL